MGVYSLSALFEGFFGLFRGCKLQYKVDRSLALLNWMRSCMQAPPNVGQCVDLADLNLITYSCRSVGRLHVLFEIQVGDYQHGRIDKELTDSTTSAVADKLLHTATVVGVERAWSAMLTSQQDFIRASAHDQCSRALPGACYTQPVRASSIYRAWRVRPKSDDPLC